MTRKKVKEPYFNQKCRRNNNCKPWRIHIIEFLCLSAVGLDKHPRWERAPYLRLTFFLLQILSAEVLRSSGEKREMFEQLNLINCKYFTVLSWLALPRLSYVWKFLDHRSLLDILSFRTDFILVSWEFLQLPQRQLAQHLLQATPHPHRHQVQAGLHI